MKGHGYIQFYFVLFFVVVVVVVFTIKSMRDLFPFINRRKIHSNYKINELFKMNRKLDSIGCVITFFCPEQSCWRLQGLCLCCEKHQRSPVEFAKILCLKPRF